VLFHGFVDLLAARLAVLVLLLAVAALVGWRYRRSSGRAKAVDAGDLLTADQLGAELGREATLVQFSSPVCAPCRSTRRLLADVAGDRDGVRHVELDAEQHLDLVRRLNVLRTPTVLVLDAAGRVVARSSGAPTRRQVDDALALTLAASAA
jgi:thiol-disulfide isomerase/thioredoxin